MDARPRTPQHLCAGLSDPTAFQSRGENVPGGALGLRTLSELVLTFLTLFSRLRGLHQRCPGPARRPGERGPGSSGGAISPITSSLSTRLITNNSPPAAEPALTLGRGLCACPGPGQRAGRGIPIPPRQTLLLDRSPVPCPGQGRVEQGRSPVLPAQAAIRPWPSWVTPRCSGEVEKPAGEGRCEPRAPGMRGKGKGRRTWL